VTGLVWAGNVCAADFSDDNENGKELAYLVQIESPYLVPYGCLRVHGKREVGTYLD
jgi:hypothetical protein